MSIPVIEALRAENWAGLSYGGRMAALQEMENSLSEQDGRPPCRLGEIPDSKRILGDDGSPMLRGQHYFEPETHAGRIDLDPKLIQNDQPYQAVETYLHEARHDYQGYAVQHPEIHDNPDQVADWEKNQDGYIRPEDAEFSNYRWQPNEADANETARTRTEELYNDRFQDKDQYPEYRAQKEQELADDVDLAKIELGENYEEKAREAMLANHDYKMSLQAKQAPEAAPDPQPEIQAREAGPEQSQPETQTREAMPEQAQSEAQIQEVPPEQAQSEAPNLEAVPEQSQTESQSQEAMPEQAQTEAPARETDTGEDDGYSYGYSM